MPYGTGYTETEMIHIDESIVQKLCNGAPLWWRVCHITRDTAGEWMWWKYLQEGIHLLLHPIDKPPLDDKTTQGAETVEYLMSIIWAYNCTKKCILQYNYSK